MIIAVTILAALSFAQAASSSNDLGSQIIKAGALSRKAAKQMRLDTPSQRSTVRRELLNMAKSLSSMSATDIRWGRVIKAHPNRDPYPLLRRDFKFAKGFVKTLDELLDDSSAEANGLEAEVKTSISPGSRRILHDLREVYAQIVADIDSPGNERR